MARSSLCAVKAGTAATHGAPLGAEEIAGARKALGWPHAPFVVPEEILDAWHGVGARGQSARSAWRTRVDALDDGTRQRFETLMAGTLPVALDDAIGEFIRALDAAPPQWATRKASQEVLEVLTERIPEMIGGSADLTGSNNTLTRVQEVISAHDFSGRYLHYGVREHAMAAIMSLASGGCTSKKYSPLM